MTDREDAREAALLRLPQLRVIGVGRDAEMPRGLMLYMNREPTDDEMRAIHDGNAGLAAARAIREGKDG